MIDPIEYFPNLDENAEIQSVNQNTGTPLPSELKKEIPSFALGSHATPKGDALVEGFKPNPMALMQDQNSNLVDPELQNALESEELQEQINNLKGRLWDFRTTFEDSQTTAQFADEHFQAVGVIIDLISDDLNTIAVHTQQDAKTRDQTEDASVTRKVINWVSSGEEVLNRALLYFSDRDGSRESLANFLKVQYAVQRATQRAELFASIVGTSVSSVKTIMTTQLG
ncbi:hypothetical protein C10C_0678 [Chlamydia serpentis]|uniref:Type III secretion protein n=1 Tax=Chlamydia serpentis TaxID=1967782 RepID=A0A2R8FBY4_9CHLA|nr:hypothetical protein [Chlamydia serpentis]SPN73826.1 hypothetical protein C10C_0678 [Chlamydia serpentis]